MEGGDGPLSDLLRRAAQAVAQRQARALAAHGVTPAEWVLLRELHRAGPVAPSVLAERMGMTRGAVTKLAGRLRAKQMLVRAKDQGDARMQLLALTGAGARAVPALAAAVAEVEAWLGDVAGDPHRLRLALRAIGKSSPSAFPTPSAVRVE